MEANVKSIAAWLSDIGLDGYAGIFAKSEIDFDVLRTLSEDDLRELGLSLGARKRLALAIGKLGEQRGGLQADVAGATDAAFGQVQAASGERRQLTVMFCDLVGSTALAERLDPEQLRDLMQAYQRACGEVIGRYDGHVAQYLGDGLMVYFGWPRAHEDDAVRAIRAGLDVVKRSAS